MSEGRRGDSMWLAPTVVLIAVGVLFIIGMVSYTNRAADYIRACEALGGESRRIPRTAEGLCIRDGLIIQVRLP